jgi:hypothetical protein
MVLIKNTLTRKKERFFKSVLLIDFKNGNHSNKDLMNKKMDRTKTDKFRIAKRNRPLPVS